MTPSAVGLVGVTMTYSSQSTSSSSQSPLYICSSGKSVKIVAAAIYTLWIAIFGTPGTIPCDSCNEFNNSLIATIKKIEYKA